MSFIIVIRSPVTKKLVVLQHWITDDDSYIAEYATEDEAFAAAGQTKICQAWGFEIVELTKI